jgi:ATP-dependent Clp protease ATP-binding subunit ClpB
VVLFDEIEKAHTDVFNVLLQLLEDGRLTDGHGRTVDFRNAVVIMTSNLGSAIFQDASIPVEKRREAIVDDVRGFFRPEFVNRIDEIVVFEPLGPEQIREIVDIQVGLLSRRLADRSLTLELTGAARDLLAGQGYEPAFGARPLKRLIQREVQDPLAMSLLSGEIREGETVVVDADGGALTFRTTPAAAEQPAAAAP